MAWCAQHDRLTCLAVDTWIRWLTKPILLINFLIYIPDFILYSANLRISLSLSLSFSRCVLNTVPAAHYGMNTQLTSRSTVIWLDYFSLCRSPRLANMLPLYLCHPLAQGSPNQCRWIYSCSFRWLFVDSAKKNDYVFGFMVKANWIKKDLHKIYFVPKNCEQHNCRWIAGIPLSLYPTLFYLPTPRTRLA